MRKGKETSKNKMKKRSKIGREKRRQRRANTHVIGVSQEGKTKL